MDTMMPVKLSGQFKDEYDSQICRRRAGCFFAHMLQSYVATWEYLNHPDPQARLGALAMMLYYWKPEVDSPQHRERMALLESASNNWQPPLAFTQLCEWMALNDEDLNVRVLAIACLNAVYYGTWDTRIGQLLAAVVRDESQPLLVRKAAYGGLFSLRPVTSIPPLHTFQFPEQVDWTFVDSFFEQRESPKEVDKVAAEYPDYSEHLRLSIACRREAENAIKQGEWDAAIDFLTKSIHNSPSDAVLILRGRVYLQLGRLSEAIADYTSAITMIPSVTAYRERARAYEQMGLYEEAQRDYRVANGGRLELD